MSAVRSGTDLQPIQWLEALSFTQLYKIDGSCGHEAVSLWEISQLLLSPLNGHALPILPLPSHFCPGPHARLRLYISGANAAQTWAHAHHCARLYDSGTGMALNDAQDPADSLETGPSRRTSASRQPSQDTIHPALEDIDPTTKFLYTPHTVTGLLLGTTRTFTGLFSNTAEL